MEKRGRTEAINGETQFLEEIIHHIQSFLSGKEAARTTILSKPWYEAWLSRPDLVFSEHDIPPRSHLNENFVSFGKKTMQRYCDSKRKIRSFKVLIDGFENKNDLSDKISLTDDWTRKAMKLGATDIDIQIFGRDFVFLLPNEVLESQTLVKLYLSGSKIDLQDQKVRCSGLESLALLHVCVEGDTIWDILSVCPLLEELVLSKCYSGSYGYLLLKPRSDMNSFRKMKALSLKDVEIGDWFFHDLSSKFPCLKKLVLHLHRDGNEEIQICSESLECITFTDYRSNRTITKFDVPRIKRFNYTTFAVPSLSFKTTSTEWESYVSIYCKVPNLVKRILPELSSSRIYLDLHITSSDSSCDYPRDVTGVRVTKPTVVEKLTLESYAPFSLHYPLLADLFKSCRPNVLVFYLESSSSFKPQSFRNNDFAKFLCSRMLEEGNGYRRISGLEEFNVDFSEDRSTGWVSLPGMTLLDASKYSGESRIRVCLKMKWGK